MRIFLFVKKKTICIRKEGNGLFLNKTGVLQKVRPLFSFAFRSA